MSTETSTAMATRNCCDDRDETPTASSRGSMSSAFLATKIAREYTKRPASRSNAWHLEMGYASDIGARSTNQDCGYGNVADGVFLVADGIGGYPGGTEASHVLVDTIPPILVDAIRGAELSDEQVHETINDAVKCAQLEMREMALGEPSFAKMGSTFVVGVIANDTLYLAHLGDSRVYLVRKGTITQLTKDHTFVQALYDAGCLTEEQVKNHRLRHVITESVNAWKMSDVSVESHRLMPGDRLLFATDGLTDVVEDELLGWTIVNSVDPQVTAHELVRQALENDSHDNITCLVVHVER